METEFSPAEEAVSGADTAEIASGTPEGAAPMSESKTEITETSDTPKEAPKISDTPSSDIKHSSAEHVEELKRIEKLNEEYSNFKELFPDINISELPDEVEKSVSTGVPLDAACALHRIRREAAEKKAAAVNESNKKLSAGAVRKSTSNYLTIEEIRAMSPGEVKNNFNLILKSLENQNKN